MAFNVVFYNFSKKENSTAVPASGGTTYSCTLKDGCSIINPVIKLSLGPASSVPIGFNYCQISNFNRYYFVNDWTSDKGMWYANLSVDVLATYKTAIGNASELILRSASQTDGRVNDTLYPMINDQVWYSRDGSASPWWENVWSQTTIYTGEYVVGLLSYIGNNSVPGGINYIAIPESFFNFFMNAIFNTSNTSEPSAVAVQGQVFATLLPELTDVQARNLAYIAENPYTDYIDSITYVPIAGQASDYSSRTVYLGPNPITIDCREVNPRDMKHYTWQTSNIPKHPQAATRGSYLNLSPYSEYMLNLPRVGLVPLSAEKFADYSYLSVDLDLDPVTGEGLYQVYAGNGSNIKQLIHKTTTFLGVRLKIGTNKEVGTYLKDAAQIVSGLSGLASGNVAGLMSGIASVMHDTQAPGSGRIGDVSGFNDLYPGYPTLYSCHTYVSGQDLANCGAPLMMVRQISTLSGYVQCLHGDISVACTDTERSEIKRHLETGFFYE